MKKMILTTAAIAFTAILFGQQDVITRKNSIGMNLLSLTNTTFKLNYERQFSNMNSFVMNGGIILFQNQNREYNGACVEVQYRFNAPNNFLYKNSLAYFAPYAGYQYIDYTTFNNIYDYTGNEYTASVKTEEYSNVTGGCLFGVRTNLTTRFFVDMNIGGGFRFELSNHNRNEENIGTQNLGYSGIYPRANFTMGINF